MQLVLGARRASWNIDLGHVRRVACAVMRRGGIAVLPQGVPAGEGLGAAGALPGLVVM
jgi:hypothetical protein